MGRTEAMRGFPAMAAMVFWLSSAAAVLAHPHASIDVAVDVVFDPAGRVTALRQTWLFDEFYTADTVQKGERHKLDLLTTRILHNLKDYGYFTRILADGHPIPLAQPTERSARMEGSRLLMTFVAPLAKPVSPTERPVTYAVFDPTYFIEMLHAERPDTIRLMGAPAHCRASLVPAKPDPKAVATAAALDRTQTGGDGLGALFAETVEIRCAARP